MIIELAKLNNNELNINDNLKLPQEIYENTSILDMKEIHLKGVIKYDYEQNIVLDLEAESTFILADSITLEPIEYPFSCKIEETIEKDSLKNNKFYEKNKNILDIIEILWENIVLEIPISVTNHTIDEIKSSGEGWELVKETDKIDPRLAKLKELLDEGKE